MIVDDAATVAVAIEAEPHIGAAFQHFGGHRMQHVKVFGIRIVIWKGEIEFGVERHHLDTELFQYLRREGSGGAIAAGHHDFELTRDFRPVHEVGNIAGREILDETVGAAIRVAEFSLQNDVAQAAHLVRPKGDRPLRPHFHARPAIVVMRGGHHGDSGDVEVELREIGHRRKRQADIVNFYAGRHQADRQRMFDRSRIGPEIMAGYKFRRNTHVMDQRAKAKPQGLHAHEIDLLFEKPPRVIFAKAGRLHHRGAFIGVSIGL